MTRTPSPPRYDRPAPSEYGDFYAAYIAQVPDGDLLHTLEVQAQESTELLGKLPHSLANHSYAAGKWTVKEVLGHMIDAERVFAYRALRFARGDTTPLPSFDEQTWVPNSGAQGRTLTDLLQEQRAVREATLALLRHLPAEAPTRRGTANGREITVRALGWIIAGHERHHLRILRERYFRSREPGIGNRG